MLDPVDWGLPLPLYPMALAFGYLLGSIPFGPIFTRLAGRGDLRAIGSGNIGATNVLRTGSKSLAALTLIADILKGTLAARIATFWGGEAALIAGLGAVLGHLFPLWLGFRGGKGVATYLGVLLGIHWPAALIFCGLWLVVAALTRYSSLAALSAGAAVPAALAIFGQWQAMQLFIVLTVLVFLRHWSNITRLVAGEEAKIGGD